MTRPLTWTGDEADLLGYPDCPECLEYLTQPGMVEAAASVGIERGKSTGLMLREVVEAFHARGHQETRA